MDKIQKVVDSIIEIITKYALKRFTGQVTVVLNFNQGGIGTVELLTKETLK